MKRTILIVATLTVALIGCRGEATTQADNNGSGSNGANASNASNGANGTTMTSPDGGVDAGPTFVDSEFGLDERPSNPTCLAGERPPDAAPVRVERAFANLSFQSPLWLQREPGGDRWFVIEQAGLVRTFVGESASESEVVLDIRGRVESGGERGLLGIAFHPDWASGEKTLFLSYTGNDGGLTSFVSSFESTDDGATFDASSEDRLISASQPYGNHNGGQIAFGPDRMLYIAWGDGGSGGDPEGNGQNTETLLGAMLRIDPLGGDPYAIPQDNPFVDGGGRPEIYAWGLRNPWRFSFDRATGELWAGDVGQNAYEEISVIERGGNYGWADKEGFECFDANPCEEGPWLDPVYQYPHSEGQSVTGGYVYRGTAIPNLRGRYVFGDFRSGRIWALGYDENGDATAELINDTDLAIASFAEAPDGELYVIHYGGQIHQLLPAEESTENDAGPAQLLSETGCMDPEDPRLPGPGLVPYEPNAPFWSDGAAKSRWMAIPDGELVTTDESGDWQFPVGTVLVKSFEVDGQTVETRLFVRHDDGSWAGYSYRWNDDETEATLLQGGEVRQLGGGQEWIYPSRAECMQCHTSSAGRSLGLEDAQLDGDFGYVSTGRRANQLDTLAEIGIVEERGQPDALVDPFGSADVDARARAYLHTNCASCHRPGVASRVEMDLRWGTALEEMNAVGVAPITTDLDIDGAQRIAPGDRSGSMFWHRTNRRDAQAMPPIGSAVVDEAGVELIGTWIDGLE